MTDELPTSRVERCITALYAYASREGATGRGVNKALRKDGYTPDEITAAVDKIERSQ